MPRNREIQKVLVIGSGPIVIGQAAEFDYAGTQACRSLREEGLEVVLLNSNPATIMTSGDMADRIYIEPLTPDTVKRVILAEKPDSLLSTLGGQTGLTLSMQLAKEGFLQEHGVRLLGASPETIDKAEDRQIFKDTMQSIGEPVIPSLVVTAVGEALSFADEIGYPVIVRPAFTLGGSGGGIAEDEEALRAVAESGLRQSPITQILVEKSIAGWKEIEFEVMRDGAGNAVTVCAMENFDPVGVHTGDSIVVAPTVTLADREYQMLRSAALRIIHAMGVEGGCNCQFALHPHSFDYAVIEVNPRVSRSSALASKATGYPIAKVAAKIAVGYALDEITNAVTGKTCACFEPALDYVVVKVPRWPFDKFVYAGRTLGTQMKATGEVMAIGKNFESAILKAVRGAEIALDFPELPGLRELGEEALRSRLTVCDDRRLFTVYEALRRGISVDDIHAATGGIDRWFLAKLGNIAHIATRLERGLTDDLYTLAKRFGFPDTAIQRLSGQAVTRPLPPAYQMVDTCAGEFAAETPYFYGAWGVHDEAGPLLAAREDPRKTVVVLGSGPIRIGQGIEFDYASVQCAQSLRSLGYEVVIVNNNPETVSTDFDTSHRLYFEPLTPEDVRGVLEIEQPWGVVVAFGGGTAIKLTQYVESLGYRILGTSADNIDAAEDRERFDALLERAGIARPAGRSVTDTAGAVAAAEELGFPVLLRPSYVLGGQNMTIAFSREDVEEYMRIILAAGGGGPVLIDQYLMGLEVEVDAVCDGDDILIPGIMEHIERAGVHSGDSIAVYPALGLTGRQTARLLDYTRALARELCVRGLVNIQYVLYRGRIYVIEVNPRASRTIPYISKVTGVPVVELATRAMLGEKLSTMGYGTGLYREPPYVAVKVPVFSFEKLPQLDVQLGPEMKSTGEVLGIGKTFDEALYKGLLAAGYRMEKRGGAFLTVRDADKHEIADIARPFADMGFTLYATDGTADVLESAGLPVERVKKIYEDGEQNSLTLLESGKIAYIISTSTGGRGPLRDSTRIRGAAVARGIPCLTSMDTADALVRCLMGRYTPYSTELVDINRMRSDRMRLPFTKMHGAGNDYIYLNCFEHEVPAPGSLSVTLSNRHFSVGGDGVVLICPSQIADARMRMFNLDGSEGNMCGNAIRCVGKYIYDNGIARKETVTIETLSGVKTLRLYVQNGAVDSATVDMGAPSLLPAQVPVRLDGERVVGREVDIAGGRYAVTCVSMGNPHCVVFCDDPGGLDLPRIGPLFESDPLFPQRVNTEFVHVADEATLRVRVWERGSGETWACGTGACAAVVAAVENGYCSKDMDITVKLRGGDLVIRYTDETVYMTGQARKSFEGVVEI